MLLLSACFSSLGLALDPATHDRLIEGARRGEVLPALERFEAALSAQPAPSNRLLHDTIVLNVWAERHARALELAQRLRGSPPAYVSAALALALRRTGQYDRAIALYRELLRATPTDQGLRAELLHALVDAGRTDEAGQEVDQHVPHLSRQRQASRQQALLIAAARVREAQNRPSESLSLLLDADAIESSDETRRRISLALTRLSAPSLALAYSRSVTRSAVPTDERERLEQNETARRIAHGEVQLTLELGLARFERTADALSK
ncbi:MAG: tetratricopeptide repeat protein, partial [Casimicrobiaceae bacterium]